MSIAEKALAIFEALRPQDIRELPPARRQRFAAICRHWAAVAEPKEAPKPGVLKDLRQFPREG